LCCAVFTSKGLLPCRQSPAKNSAAKKAQPKKHGLNAKHEDRRPLAEEEYYCPPRNSSPSESGRSRVLKNSAKSIFRSVFDHYASFLDWDKSPGSKRSNNQPTLLFGNGFGVGGKLTASYNCVDQPKPAKYKIKPRPSSSCRNPKDEHQPRHHLPGTLPAASTKSPPCLRRFWPACKSARVTIHMPMIPELPAPFWPAPAPRRNSRPSCWPILRESAACAPRVRQPHPYLRRRLSPSSATGRWVDHKSRADIALKPRP